MSESTDTTASACEAMAERLENSTVLDAYGCDLAWPKDAAALIRALVAEREELRKRLDFIPTTSAKPGDSDWSRGFYACQNQLIEARFVEEVAALGAPSHD
jgi:hypothetical protein